MVGNGENEDTRSTAFAVFGDGHAELQAAGTTATSVVRRADLTPIVEVAEGKNKALVITATVYRDIPTRENFFPYDWYRVDGSMIETFDDFVEYVTRGEYPEYDLACINESILNGNNIPGLGMAGYNYILNYDDIREIVIPA